jgi:hypothetical protein
VWLELSINLTLGFLQTKQLASGDHSKADHAVIETYVLTVCVCVCVCVCVVCGVFVCVCGVCVWCVCVCV